MKTPQRSTETRGSSCPFAFTGVGYHPQGHCVVQDGCWVSPHLTFSHNRKKEAIKHRKQVYPRHLSAFKHSLHKFFFLLTSPCPECRHLVTLAAINFFTSQVCKFDFYNLITYNLLSYPVSWWLKEDKKLLGFINHRTAFSCRIPWSLSPMGIMP